MTGGPGLDGLGARAARLLRPGPCLLVTDRTVGRLYAARALAALRRAGFAPRIATVPPGERSKSLAAAAGILGTLARMGAGRDTPVVALGGGVVTDLAGFAAAVWARGAPWIAVPTTLLAMADAAVGGKTGVDLPGGKNLVGAFHAPVLVLADRGLLKTLPARHLRNGTAEIAKMDLLPGLRTGLPRVRRLARAAGDPVALGAAAARAATAKARIVARDPLERRGERILLNLGHTVGHALEAATGYDGSVLHGEAVSVGIAVAARIAEGRGLLRSGEAAQVASAFEALGLPVSLPGGIGARAILDRVALDKKREGAALRMVLPRSAGRAIVKEVGRKELAGALR